MTCFALRPGLDPAALANMFASAGRLQIVDFLRPDCATALLKELAGSRDWRLAFNDGERILDFREADVAAWPPEKKMALARAVTLGGRDRFQYCYETIRLPGKEGGSGSSAPRLLQRFVEFLCSPEIIEFMRQVTGADDITFADTHASRYKPGHFLTTHDDKMDDMGRRAAYVLNLTPRWRPDWGGLLLFYDSRGNVVRGFAPAFNSLNIFKVPQPHSVSWVTPLAAQPRYAVTGWLRAGEPG
jgi:Rps23 Pro-64 3,4-dihydroxylase Tpa1-like proline 4-hydroxylase